MAKRAHVGRKEVKQHKSDGAAKGYDKDAVENPLPNGGGRLNRQQIFNKIGGEDGGRCEQHGQSHSAEIDHGALLHFFAEQEEWFPQKDHYQEADKNPGHNAGHTIKITQKGRQTEVERGFHQGGINIFIEAVSTEKYIGGIAKQANKECPHQPK